MSVTKAGSKTFYTTTNPFEQSFGYHRALRHGPHIHVSGTTALNPTTQCLQHPNDPYLQAHAAFAEALEAVRALGGQVHDVVRVRMFVKRVEDCDGVGRAFGEVFGGAAGQGGVRGGGGEEGGREGSGEVVGCAATMVVLGAEGGGGFVDEGMLVEVEVDAYVL
ncbi:uncharacterized protein HMPREF1541_11017 [Cyphellophora europaea CBS 101466]|uniref:YjgF-like protein n=1 Tax=Cyphellophora europaea (strain CBS 101466) TaxID=1220924 RepID=W2S5C3_CYPE1|nr:uncharacterized protein HMPREF1541_11017 [Cyphellophora europaea CBS 101466]ETN43886.1 hypothetical protein HMPREF1541_11017 [Cyphellophora europaea CBS 101466]